jgi:hypothetical protein
MLTGPREMNRYMVGLWDGTMITCPGVDDEGNKVMHTGRPREVAQAKGVKVWEMRPHQANRRLRAWQRELLQERYPEAAIVLGRDYSGAGASLWGWWAKMPSGAALYLGRTLYDAVRR